MGNGSSDFDPLILKGLRLLMSKREESAVELRQLFDETLAQRRKLKGDYPGPSKPYVFPSKSGGSSSAKHDGKRPLDKTGSDVKPDAKRPKLDRDGKDKVKLPQVSPNDGREEFTMDFVLETFGLACEVCKKAEPTQMLECNLCKKTYHQSCHQSNGGKDSYDPRNVWFCNKCKPASIAPSPAKSSTSGQEQSKLSKTSSSSHSSKHKKSSASGYSKHGSSSSVKKHHESLKKKSAAEKKH